MTMLEDGAISTPTSMGAENRTWDDNYNETSFSPDGKSGNQWEDWGKVMYQAIAPPLGCLEDVLRRTPIEDPLDQAEIDLLWALMNEEITCPAGHYNLELRFLHEELQILSRVLITTDGIEDDQPFNLDPSDWKDYGSLFYRLPLTRLECHDRMTAIRNRMRDLHGLIDVARTRGVFYDVCGLIDWFATPPDRRSTSSPSHALAFFGRKAFALLGLAAQNTQWAHIEAVTSRQIAPRFGGNYYENEKTRFRSMNPEISGASPTGVASNAPR